LARIKEKRRELKLLSAEREQAAVMEQAWCYITQPRFDLYICICKYIAIE
jgi:hypothetical protein